MKISKRQLRRIIKEEKQKLIAENKVRRAVRRRLFEAALPSFIDNSLAMLAGDAAIRSALFDEEWNDGEEYVEDFMRPAIETLLASPTIEAAVELASEYVGLVQDAIVDAARRSQYYDPKIDSDIVDLVSDLGTRLLGFFEAEAKQTSIWGR